MLIELSAQRTKQIAQNNIQCKLELTIFCFCFGIFQFFEMFAHSVATTNCLECSVEYEQHFHFNEIHLSKFQTYAKQNKNKKISL